MNKPTGKPESNSPSEADPVKSFGYHRASDPAYSESGYYYNATRKTEIEYRLLRQNEAVPPKGGLYNGIVFRASSYRVTFNKNGSTLVTTGKTLIEYLKISFGTLQIAHIMARCMIQRL